MSDKKLQVIPLGGLGEFGMNSMAIRYGDDIVVIDAGMMFPDAELLGVDIVTPDFAYLREHKAMVRGLLLTHGHEDHIGGVPFLLADINTPVYGTPFTLALVERRLDEHSMLDQVQLNEVQPGDTYLLCSDGLSDMLDDDSLANLLNGNPALPEAARALINAANDSGGRDNIALILARAEGRVKAESRSWWPFGKRGG